MTVSIISVFYFSLFASKTRTPTERKRPVGNSLLSLSAVSAMKRKGCGISYFAGFTVSSPTLTQPEVPPAVPIRRTPRHAVGVASVNVYVW